MSLDNVKLSIKNLDLFYGDNQALKDINIEIKNVDFSYDKAIKSVLL